MIESDFNIHRWKVLDRLVDSLRVQGTPEDCSYTPTHQDREFVWNILGARQSGFLIKVFVVGEDEPSWIKQGITGVQEDDTLDLSSNRLGELTSTNTMDILLGSSRPAVPGQWVRRFPQQVDMGA